jgi:hypothetical protein
MKRKLLIAVVFTFIVVPTALVSAFWSLMGGGMVLAAVLGDPSVRGVGAPGVALLLIGGWFGISALWKLSVHFFYNSTRPARPCFLFGGLLCGTAVAVSLILSSGGSLEFRLAFFGPPVLAASVLAVLLWRSRNAT